MNVFGIIMFFVGIAAFIVSFVFLARRVRTFAKTTMIEAFNIHDEFVYFGICSSIFTVGGILFACGLPFICTSTEFFAFQNMLAYEWILLIIGGGLFFANLAAMYISFRLHYYQLKLPEKMSKRLYYIFIISLVAFWITLFIFTQGFANHLIYPLINGISFSGGMHFTTCKSGSPNLAWYAICIIGGAILVYFMADHRMYQKFGKHGLLESTFFVAFPAGIIGARIAYVIGNWSTEFANRDFWHVFAIWEGGLTILGGAIAGIVVGVLWFIWRHPKLSIFDTVDICIPVILVAQAVGRWGNFFNGEVHGVAMSLNSWNWLPSIITNQLRFSSTAPTLEVGQIYAPLFLIEAFINVCGWFVMAFVFKKMVKGVTEPGDNMGGYLIWYGFTRVFMEPLRYASYNMGADGRWSWIWSIIFVAAGFVLITCNHLIRRLLSVKKDKALPVNMKHEIITMCVLTVLSLVGLGLGIYFYTCFTIPAGSLIQYCEHNIGLVLIIVCSSLFVVNAIPLTKLFTNKPKANLQVNE